jgi:transposase
MERKQRRKFSADFKTKVVIEALKERNTIEQLAKKYELHPNQITIWKKEFLANASRAFSGDSEKPKGESDPDIEKLYAQIGQLSIENKWLKKKLD